jgi:hypothetical protein
MDESANHGLYEEDSDADLYGASSGDDAGDGGSAPPSPVGGLPTPAPPAGGPSYWNMEYQQILADTTDLTAKLSKIADLRERFLSSQLKVAVTLIKELHLPAGSKTHKPAEQCGSFGAKYSVDGVFFKIMLASDDPTQPHTCYSDEVLAKAAGNEFKAHEALLRTGSEQTLVQMPMMCLLDISGYRVMASVEVPLYDGSLRYGTRDACKTAVSVEKAKAILQPLAQRLNLKPHAIITLSGTTHTMVTAADVELHRGLDRRYYLLDTARFLPPLAPMSRLPGLGAAAPGLVFLSPQAAASWVKLPYPKLGQNGKFSTAYMAAVNAALGVSGCRQWMHPGGRVAVFYSAVGQCSEAACRYILHLACFGSKIGCTPRDPGQSWKAALAAFSHKLKGHILVTLTLGNKDHLTKLMRQEFLLTSEHNINPDSYISKKICPDAADDNRIVDKLTAVLLQQTVPACAAALEALAQDKPAGVLLAGLLSPTALKVRVHRFGVNLRFLGRIRAACRSANLRELLLAHMVARAAACKMAAALRAAPQAFDTSVVLAHYNALCGHCENEGDFAHYWFDIKLMCCDKFEGGLLDAELGFEGGLFDLLSRSCRVACIQQVEELSSIVAISTGDRNEAAARMLDCTLGPEMRDQVAFMPNFKIPSPVHIQNQGATSTKGSPDVSELEAKIQELLSDPPKDAPAVQVPVTLLSYLHQLVVALLRSAADDCSELVSLHITGATSAIAKAQRECLIALTRGGDSCKHEHNDAVKTLGVCYQLAAEMYELVTSKQLPVVLDVSAIRTLSDAVGKFRFSKELLKYAAEHTHGSGVECLQMTLLDAMDDATFVGTVDPIGKILGQSGPEFPKLMSSLEHMLEMLAQ